MGNLDRIHIRHAPLSNRIVIARFGKEESVALETRDAMDEFFKAILSYAFDGKMPSVGKSAEITFGGGDEQFKLNVERIGKPR